MSNNNYEVGSLLKGTDPNPAYNRTVRGLSDAHTIIVVRHTQDNTVRKLKSLYKETVGQEWSRYNNPAHHTWLWCCGDYRRDRTSYDPKAMPVVSSKSEDKPDPRYNTIELMAMSCNGNNRYTIVYHREGYLPHILGNNYSILPFDDNRAEEIEENKRLVSLCRVGSSAINFYTQLVAKRMKLPAGFRLDRDTLYHDFPVAYLRSGGLAQAVGSNDDSLSSLPYKRDKLLWDWNTIQLRLKELDRIIENKDGFEAIVPPQFRVENWARDARDWVYENLLTDEEKLDKFPNYTTPTNNFLMEWQVLFDSSGKLSRIQSEGYCYEDCWGVFIELARVFINQLNDAYSDLNSSIDHYEWPNQSSTINWKEVGECSILEKQLFEDHLWDWLQCIKSKTLPGEFVSKMMQMNRLGPNYRDTVSIVSRFLHRIYLDENLQAEILAMPSMKEQLGILWEPVGPDAECHDDWLDLLLTRRCLSPFARHRDNNHIGFTFDADAYPYGRLEDLDWDHVTPLAADWREFCLAREQMRK